jgi:hypothetical protein
MIDAKNVQGKKNLFGQFFTPDELSKSIIDKQTQNKDKTEIKYVESIDLINMNNQNER